jgi:hypothetical protein
MAKYDDFQNVHSVVTACGSVQETANSIGLDTKGMEQVTALAISGLLGASDTVDVKVQDSADNSVWADLTGAVFTQLTDTEDNTVLVGTIKCNQASTPVRRYLRIVVVNAGTLTGSGCGVLIGSNLSGHIPYVTNALPAPVFQIGNP